MHLDHLADSFASRVRPYMLDEIAYDEARANVYVSPRLTEVGRRLYLDLLKEAVLTGSDGSLASKLRDRGCIAAEEVSHSKKGTSFSKKVPIDAHETLAEGEFNRYYLRGLCLVAIDDGATLEVYRARDSVRPRPDSEQLIGREVNPETLLSDLRRNVGFDTFLGLARPNSGLSCRLRIAVPTGVS